MRYRAVLFDLDGTLIDSGEMILASMRHATRTVTGRELTDEEYRAGIGTPLVAQMQIVDASRVDELVRVYSEHNATLHSDLAACAGVFDVVARLHSEGRRLAIVTAKRRATVALAAEHVPELDEYFDVVVAAEDTERHKPHPEPILLALDRLDVERSTAAYVGDSPFDVQAGKAAGVTAIAVTWGRIHSREQLARHGPDAIVDTAEELLGRL